MGCCDFLGSFTAEKTMVLAKWILDLPFIHSHGKYHNFRIVFLYFVVFTCLLIHYYYYYYYYCYTIIIIIIIIIIIMYRNRYMSHEKQWNDRHIYVKSGVIVYPQPPIHNSVGLVWSRVGV